MNVPKSAQVIDQCCMQIPPKMAEAAKQKPLLSPEDLKWLRLKFPPSTSDRAAIIRQIKNDISETPDKKKLLTIKSRIGQFFESPIGRFLVKVLGK